MLRWIHRLSVPLLASLLATFALLTVMRSLVRVGSSHLNEKPARTVIEFLPTKRVAKLETKKRELPRKRATPVQQWTPQVQVSSSTREAVAIRVPLQTASVGRPDLALAGGPALGAGASDGDVVPLVRVNPMYPPRARARKVEGWVWLEFTITAHGTTRDVRVLDSDPKGYFEKAALAAVQKYRYKPRTVDGQAVDRGGVQVVLSFDIAG